MKLSSPVSVCVNAQAGMAFLLTGIVLCLTTGAFAQGPFTASAIALAKEGKLEEAEYKLAAAMASEESEEPMTWYVKAFVLKQRYITEGQRPGSPLREEALDAARTCMALDPAGNIDPWLHPLLHFLGDSYLTDIRDAIALIAPGQPSQAERLFDSYAETQRWQDPDWNSDPEWVLMQQQLAEMAMSQARMEEAAGAGPWFELGAKHYQQAISKNHDRFRSFYNLAVHTYNQGVREFKASEDDLDAIDAALLQAAGKWQRASELLEQAIGKDSSQPKAYEALAIVSTALLNQDRIDWCKSHLEELGGH